jgi:hypothetical protein
MGTVLATGGMAWAITKVIVMEHHVSSKVLAVPAVLAVLAILTVEQPLAHVLLANGQQFYTENLSVVQGTHRTLCTRCTHCEAIYSKETGHLYIHSLYALYSLYGGEPPTRLKCHHV